MKYYKYIVPLGIVFILYLIYRYFFGESHDEIKVGEALDNLQSSPVYLPVTDYSSYQGFKEPLLTNNEVIKISNEIWDAFGVFNDDEEQLYSAVRKVQRIYDSFRISHYMQFTFGEDARTLIASRISDNESYKIWQILKTYK